MKTNITIIMALLVILSTFIPGIDHGIWRPDEPQVAGISAEAARTGDFVVPRLNGHPFLEKPPLYYDTAALSAMIFGHGSDVPLRLASVAYGALTVLLVFAMVRRRSGPLQGLAAAGILASTWGFFMLARWLQVDTALVFSVTLTMYLYLRIQERPSFTGSILLGLALGVSFMAKGLVGPAMFVSALLVDMAVKKDLRVLWNTKPHIAAIAAVLPVAPWIWGLYARGGWPFLRETLVVNNLMRFLGIGEGAALGHQNPPYYYIIHLPADILPWTLLLVPALAAALKNFRKNPYLPWFLGPLALLFLSSTRRSVYLVPIYPAMACLVSAWLMDTLEKKPWEAWTVKITWGIAVIGSVLPLLGVWIGRPVLGVVLAGASIVGLALLTRERVRSSLGGLSLVLAICLAFACFMPFYFEYKKPREDFMPFVHEALSAAKGRPVTIYLGEDEILEGVMPMVKGSSLPMRKAGQDLPEGLYAWAETRDRKATKELSARGEIRIVTHKKVGSKYVSLAAFSPAKTAGKDAQ
jgi:4-amino-4-deoxy-L-arabinose transferase-like glycosyltransferase